MATKKSYSPEFKAKVVQELMRADLTANQISSKYKIHVNTLKSWKNKCENDLYILFGGTNNLIKEYKEETQKLKEKNEQLAKTVGNLTVEKEYLEGKLKNSVSFDERKEIIDSESKNLSIKKQCELSGVSKSTHYYKNKPKFSSPEEIELLNTIDEIYMKFPVYGYRRMLTAVNKRLIEKGFNFSFGKKKIRSAMKFMGLEAIYKKPKTSIANKYHKKFPYLLKELKNTENQVITSRVNQVWAGDITYIRLKGGFVYLAAIIDWHTKKILSWRLSNTMDLQLTSSILEDALHFYPKPEIFNSDQGSQYTAKQHIEILENHKINISMNGKGRSIDNIAIERFWKTLKYEDIYLQDYETMEEAKNGINAFIKQYNEERLHSSLGNETPNKNYYENISISESNYFESEEFIKKEAA